jgi:hypothetical protein
MCLAICHRNIKNKHLFLIFLYLGRKIERVIFFNFKTAINRNNEGDSGD